MVGAPASAATPGPVGAPAPAPAPGPGASQWELAVAGWKATSWLEPQKEQQHKIPLPLPHPQLPKAPLLRRVLPTRASKRAAEEPTSEAAAKKRKTTLKPKAAESAESGEAAGAPRAPRAPKAPRAPASATQPQVEGEKPGTTKGRFNTLSPAGDCLQQPLKLESAEDSRANLGAGGPP